MPANQLCLTDDTLRSLMLGTYDGHDAETVSDHLLACPTCGQKAESMVKSDPLLADLHAVGDTSELGPDGTFVEELLQRVRKVALGKLTTKADLAFLGEPLPGYPNDLGTLDRYRVLELLGQGGMGMVFKAIDPMLKRTVALKVILPKYASDAKLRERFLEEARATVAVRSPHVAEVYDCGVWKDVPFLTMELLSGITLDKKSKPMPPETWVAIATDIAMGLSDAHRRGVIHRDLKPSNIHLGTDARTGKPTVKIIDFGLARPAEREITLTRAGEVLGTPAYMSPEQALGQADIDGRTDLYSLGVIVHQLATGKLPYLSVRDGAGVNAILAELVTPAALPSVRNLAPTLSPALSAVVDKLLAKDRADRYPSADAVVEAFRHAGQSHDLLETAAYPTRLAKPTAKPRRYRSVIAAGVILLALIGVGVGLGLRDKRPDGVVEPSKPIPPEKTTVHIGSHDRRHAGQIHEADLSPALGLALTYSWSDGLKLWNTADLKLVATGSMTLFQQDSPLRIALLNREWVVAAGGHYIWVLKLVGDKYTLRHTYDLDDELVIHQMAASPDGKWLGMSHGKQVSFWSLDDLQASRPAVAKIEGIELVDDVNDFGRFCRFSPDGQTFGVYVKGGVQLTNRASGTWKKGALISTDEVVGSFAFDDATKTAFVCSSRRQTDNPHYIDGTTTKLRRWQFTGTEPKLLDTLDLPKPFHAGRVELAGERGYVLSRGINNNVAFKYTDKMKIVFGGYRDIGYGESTNSYIISDTEILVLENTRLRKFQYQQSSNVEPQPEPAVHNLYRTDRGYFARHGDRVMIVSREPGSPVRVWSIAGPKAELLFEQASKGGGSQDQLAALSADGKTVLIAEANVPLAIWSSDKQGKYRTTTFGDASIGHEPLGISNDGKFAFTYAADTFYVWRSDEVAKPVTVWKFTQPKEGGYRETRIIPTADGWRVLLIGPGDPIKYTDLVDVTVTGDQPTFAKDKPVSFPVATVAGRELFTTTRATRQTGFSMHWVIEDRRVMPAFEELIPMPADFGEGRYNWGGIYGSISPSGKTLVAYKDSLGQVILFDRATKKTTWQHDFAAGLWRVDLLDDTRLMLVYGDGVLEVVDTKAEEKK